MNARQEIARAEVEKETGEEGELDANDARVERDQAGHDGAENGRDGIEREKRNRAPGAIARDQHERDGVESVGEVVGDDGEQHDPSGPRPGLESDADRQPVEKAVKRQPESAGDADLVMMSRRVMLLLAVDDRQLLEQEDADESAQRNDHQ